MIPFMFLLKCVGSLLVAAIITACCVLKRWEVQRIQLLQKDCVHMKGYPIVGFLPQFAAVNSTTDLYKFLCHLVTSDAGKISSFSVLHQFWTIVKDPLIVEKVMNSQYALGRTSEYSIFRCISQGVFTANGSLWKKMRRNVIKTLTSDLLRDYYDDYVPQLSKLCCNVLGKTEGYVDVYPLVARYYLDLILRTHFGMHSNEIEENKYGTMESLEKLLDLAFGKVVLRPHLHYDFFYNRSIYRTMAIEMRVGLHRPIEVSSELRYPEWKQNKERNGGVPENSVLLDDTFQLIDELKMEQGHETYTSLMTDIIVGATDTTGCGTSTCLYYLSIYPHYQERLYQEIKENWPDDSELTRDILNELSFTEMCLREAIRLSSPYALLRYVSQDLHISDGCTIPKGTKVFIPVEYLHTNLKYYKRPTEFYPEHFTPEAMAARPKSTFLAFSYGPRSCPGANYGLQAGKSLLAHIIKEYRVETNLRLEDVEYKLHLMKQFCQGYPIKFVKRSKQ